MIDPYFVTAESPEGELTQLYFGTNAAEADAIYENHLLDPAISLLTIYGYVRPMRSTGPIANLAVLNQARSADAIKARSSADAAKARAELSRVKAESAAEEHRAAQAAAEQAEAALAPAPKAKNEPKS